MNSSLVVNGAVNNGDLFMALVVTVLLTALLDFYAKIYGSGAVGIIFGYVVAQYLTSSIPPIEDENQPCENPRTCCLNFGAGIVHFVMMGGFMSLSSYGMLEQWHNKNHIFDSFHYFVYAEVIVIFLYALQLAAKYLRSIIKDKNV